MILGKPKKGSNGERQVRPSTAAATGFEVEMSVNSKQFDAIVVGSGINGLASALHLAQQGWKVLVVEQNAKPGGAVKTAECTLPGFHHDMFAMNLSMFASSPFYVQHGKLLESHGAELLPVRQTFASAFPDGTWLGVDQDIDCTTARIAALSTKDARQWRALSDDFQKNAPYLFRILSAEMPSLNAVKALYSAWRQRGNGWLRYACELALQTPREWLDGHFENDKLKTTMAAWGMHLDFSPDTTGGAMFPYLESMASQSAGMVLGKGGVGTIIDAMMSVIKACHGEVLLGTRVREIEVHNGRALGVVLDDGRKLHAKRAVIANLAPKTLLSCLPEAGKALFPSRLEKFRHGPGTMMIHLAVDALPRWTAGPELGGFAYVHLAPSMAGMTTAYAQASDGLLPAEPVVVVGQPTAFDPDRAPKGKHVLWIQVRVVPGEILGDAKGILNEREWDLVKDAFADRVLDIVEKYAPSFKSSILARHVLSPIDLERENPNLVGGDNVGGSHHPLQNFFMRPAWGMSRYRTPVRSLYLVGASTWPGGGTGAGSGYLCAVQLSKKWG